MEITDYPKPSNTLSIAGLAIGLLAIIVALIPCFGMVAYIPAICGLIFAIIGLAQNERYRTSRSIAVTGITISLCALLVAGIWPSMMTALTRRMGHQLEQHVDQVLDNIEQKVQDARRQINIGDRILTDEEKANIKEQAGKISDITQKMAAETLKNIHSVEVEAEGHTIIIRIPENGISSKQIKNLETEVYELEAKIQRYLSDFTIRIERTPEKKE